MKLRKVFVLAILTLSLITISSCFKEDKKEESEVDKIIAMAEKMSFKELSMKAIEESNGKTFYGLGNSSRGKTALEPFIEYLKTIDPSYDMKFEWQQPKNNKIFDQLAADSNKKEGTYAMTLIQDGNQIKSKMVDIGLLKTFIPKEWASVKNINVDEYDGYLELQTLNKVFMFNNTGEKVFDNCWDFVGKGANGLFMDIDSEVVGKNFLYMLTSPKYSAYLKDAFNQLSQVERDYFQKTIDEVAKDAESFKLGANGKYALAWIKLWVNSYNAQTDDGPICNKLAEASTVDGFGLLVYSKLRSIVETENVSANNVTVVAYQKGQEIYDSVNYEGIGGFGYCHYLFVTNNSPLPWTACAFNAYMTLINTEGKTDEEKIAGFSAWGKDMGGYSSNPDLQALNEKVFNHKKAGTDSEGKVVFDAKNDRGYDWWINEGKLVVENPEYCQSVEFTVGSWIELLDRK